MDRFRVERTTPWRSGDSAPSGPIVTQRKLRKEINGLYLIYLVKNKNYANFQYAIFNFSHRDTVLS
jgi:hypothetical protein